MIDRTLQKNCIELLTSLLQIFSEIDWRNDEQKSIVLEILQDVDDKCKNGLSADRYKKYHELLNTLQQTILNTDWLSLKKAEWDECKKLCADIADFVRQMLREETEIKKEIVFLPYKASMWDSLESVWKKAYEDKEHCNAYVIPIPYADLNPDRSVAKWNCERDLFPEYVPTLDWQQIDLKAWHPDVIYIHNPYDNANRVTSVESRFYSSNLKNCTDKLVYIPYFILEEPQDRSDWEDINVVDFVLTPAVLNADEVILQSEAMRQAYINVLTKHTNQKDRAFWEKRISGAGSPKIDKVLTSKKTDYPLPKPWRKIVEGKKVILYNNSIGATLQNADKICQKLRYVFEVFCERNDVALWWRPHPLMKSTLHSMEPQIEAEYSQIEQRYINEGWGIYDESPDLHRAICWSDAYYGDFSSVLWLYEWTKKPIMLQDMGINIV